MSRKQPNPPANFPKPPPPPDPLSNVKKLTKGQLKAKRYVKRKIWPPCQVKNSGDLK